VKKYAVIFICFLTSNFILSQENADTYYKIEGDSIFSSHINLKEVTIYKPINLETNEDLVMYYTLKRKTLKVYPYAKMASERLTKLNSRLTKIISKRKKKKYTRILEKFLQDELTAELKRLTRTEGQILVKLIHRETGITAYNLVKELRNGFRAFTYNSVAKIFDISLKREYDPKNIKEDIFIEDILRKNIN
tara:strand:- start:311 stop:886 length:576 start_codon:yes stop_codon:yes gene_type:complete